MTVLLLGIGADTTNCAPTPPIYEDGRFEYIPIPERLGPAGTTEQRTYGNTTLRHRDAPLARVVETITPGGPEGPRIRGEELASWPLHYDPNFEALTYGETYSRPAYTKRLGKLAPGDIVAFYTGLQAEPEAPRHRYLIGAFTVETVVDCRRLAGGDTRFSATDQASREALMETFAANAHAKRYAANGEIVAPDDGLVLVNGTTPGGRFARAMRISDGTAGPHYYLAPELDERWAPAPNGNPQRTAYLGGVKPAHLLDVEPAQFWADVADYR